MTSDKALLIFGGTFVILALAFALIVGIQDPEPPTTAPRVDWSEGFNTRLRSSGKYVFVAANAACFADWKAAGSLQETDRRLRILEMERVGCLYAEPSGTAVKALKRNDGVSFSILIQEHPDFGRDGIVHGSFLEDAH